MVYLDTEFLLDDGENAAVTLVNNLEAELFLCDEFNHLGLIHASLADTRLVTTLTLTVCVRRLSCLYTWSTASDLVSPPELLRLEETIGTFDKFLAGCDGDVTHQCTIRDTDLRENRLPVPGDEKGVETVGFTLAESFLAASFTRFLIDFDEGFLYITTLRSCANWIPAREFATLSGLMTGTTSLGGIITATPFALEVVTIGWRTTVDTLAVVGLLAALWLHRIQER